MVGKPQVLDPFKIRPEICCDENRAAHENEDEGQWPKGVALETGERFASLLNTPFVARLIFLGLSAQGVGFRPSGAEPGIRGILGINPQQFRSPWTVFICLHPNRPAISVAPVQLRGDALSAEDIIETLRGGGVLDLANGSHAREIRENRSAKRKAQSKAPAGRRKLNPGSTTKLCRVRDKVWSRFVSPTPPNISLWRRNLS